MLNKRIAAPVALAIAATLTLSACAANEPAETEPTAAALSGVIDGAGASSQGAAQEAWIAAFQTANGDVTVNYDPSGSGAGREAFIAGGVMFAGSDSALKDEEIAAGFAACVADTPVVQVPAYISPIALVFNIEGVDELNLDAATIAGIFTGKITKWNDKAIVALNEGVELPNENITAVHRSDDSGTTKNFADYLFQNAPDVWTEEPSDTFPYDGGEAAQGTSGVIQAVSSGQFTIGYADASKAGDLSTAALKVGDTFVNYSAAAAAKVVEGSPAASNATDTNLAIKLNRKTTSADEYPLVLVSYLIACSEYQDPGVGTLVKAYFEYVTSEKGQADAAAAGSAPLSASVREAVAAAVAVIK